MPPGVLPHSLGRSELQEGQPGEDVGGGEGAKVQSGLILLGVDGGAKKPSHAGKSRMDALMDQYTKQTAEHHRRTEREQAALKGPNASSRGQLDMSVRGRVKRTLARWWKQLTSCVDCLCNGGSADDGARLDDAPINLGGIHRKVVERCFVTQVHLKKLRKVFRTIDFRCGIVWGRVGACGRLGELEHRDRDDGDACMTADPCVRLYQRVRHNSA